MLGLISICGISFLTDKNKLPDWKIKSGKTDSSGIAWAKFYWSNNSIGKKEYKKAFMHIPVKVEGLPYNFSFQWDLGATTVIYEQNAKSVFQYYPEFKHQVTRLKSILQFWNSVKIFKNLTLNFGDITAIASYCEYKINYGEKLNLERSTDSSIFQLGSIGADLFRNKILIIDYPNERFAVCDSMPDFYKVSFSDIELDQSGRVLLPLHFRNKNYKILFDNGSSMFPLLVTDDRINEFSTAPATDTLDINSWGIIHKVISRPIKDSFQLGGQTFSNIMIYTEFRKEARTGHYDAIAGNVLFWNKTIVIDFKNRKFGVR